MRFLTVGAGIVVALTAGAPLAHAQGSAAPSGQPGIRLVVGGGGTFALSQPGPDRDAGAAVLGGIELGRPWRSGIAGRLGARLEGGFTRQNLSVPGSTLSGDVQTAYGAVLATLALSPRGPFDSYLLAGPVWSRPSTKLVLDSPPSQTPGAAFEQTTHETVAGALAGIGVGVRVRSAVVRVEARWMSLATANKSTTMVPIVLSLAVPLHR